MIIKISSFSDFNFKKLNLVNFDSFIVREGELLPGFEFVKHFGLIKFHQKHRCVNLDCPDIMTIEKRAQLKLKHRYHCNVCNYVINLGQYTWFSGSRLDLIMSLKLVYLWTTKCSVKLTSRILGVNKNTVVYYFNELRQLCIDKCSESNKKIGGEGHEVELDETMVFHRKYNRGRLLYGEKKKSWVVGGIDRNTNACFAELVEDRKSETIKELITRRVYPKTRIITDKWRAYLCLKNYDYTVEQVNHSKKFVDPIDPTINTQKIERAWGSLKQCLPKTASGEDRCTYIGEFVYRKTYTNNLKMMVKILKQF